MTWIDCVTMLPANFSSQTFVQHNYLFSFTLQSVFSLFNKRASHNGFESALCNPLEPVSKNGQLFTYLKSLNGSSSNNQDIFPAENCFGQYTDYGCDVSYPEARQPPGIKMF